jgi:nitrite reductase (NADH) large subunit
MSARAEQKKGSDPSSSQLRIRAQDAEPGAPTRVHGEEAIVVVGGGIAGHALCRAIEGTRLSHRPDLTIFSDESAAPYDRVRLSEAISGSGPAALELAPLSWYGDRGIALYLGDRVTRIDRGASCVVTEGGRTVPYDRLVLATGSRAIRPRIPGIDDPRCFVYRSLEDVHALSDAIDEAVASAVIGGGLLGLEASKVLLDRGHTVHVIESGERLMPRQLDAASAESLQIQIENMGVVVHAREQVTAIERTGDRLRLRLLGGRTLIVDLVVVAAGIRPCDELAHAAELDCDPGGGIIVDDFLRTSDPKIYAIGECARHRGLTYGLAGPCHEMARAVAQSFFVRATRFERGDVSCRLKVLGVDVTAIGDYEGRHERVVAGGVDGSRVVHVDGGRLVGAVSVGAWPERDDVELAVARRVKISRPELEKFRRTGNLLGGGTIARPSSWPRDTIVCACAAVTSGEIVKLRDQGITDIAGIAKATGATTGCGSCQPLVEAIVSRSKLVSGRRAWGLLVLSIVAIAVGVVLGLGPRLRLTIHAVDAWQTVDWFWRRHLLKQVTGFVAVGLIVPGFLLSLKRRARWPKAGHFNLYRAVHAGLGVLTLLAVAVHTGLRLGMNLNLVLVTCFLTANLAGAIVGVLASLESRALSSTGRFARRFRARAALLHVLLLWPLPVLLALHVLASFYF